MATVDVICRPRHSCEIYRGRGKGVDGGWLWFVSCRCGFRMSRRREEGARELKEHHETTMDGVEYLVDVNSWLKSSSP